MESTDSTIIEQQNPLKTSVMKEANKSSLLMSLGGVSQWMSGFVGIYVLGKFGAAAATVGLKAALGSLFAVSTGMWVPVALWAGFYAAAVICNYYSSQKFSSYSFDLAEHTAQRTATLLGDELAQKPALVIDQEPVGQEVPWQSRLALENKPAVRGIR